MLVLGMTGWGGVASAQDRPAATAGAPTTAASPAGTATKPTGVADELVRAERTLLTAITARDSAALERLLAPTFMLVSAYSQGEVTARRDWVHGVLDRHSADAAELSAPVVTLHTAGTATVVSRVLWTVKDPGPTPEHEDYLVTDTWVKRGARWQLAARHSSTRRPGAAP
jgi:hypothetical protein